MEKLFDGLNLALIIAADMVVEPAHQHGVQFFGDIFTSLKACLEFRYFHGKQFVHPPVRP